MDGSDGAQMVMESSPVVSQGAHLHRCTALRPLPWICSTTLTSRVEAVSAATRRPPGGPRDCSDPAGHRCAHVPQPGARRLLRRPLRAAHRRPVRGLRDRRRRGRPRLRDPDLAGPGQLDQRRWGAGAVAGRGRHRLLGAGGRRGGRPLLDVLLRRPRPRRAPPAGRDGRRPARPVRGHRDRPHSRTSGSPSTRTRSGTATAAGTSTSPATSSRASGWAPPWRSPSSPP